MKIKYIVNLRIPTEKAHGYQICKMCAEFSRAGAEVELWVPEHAYTGDLFSYYGLERNFAVRPVHLAFVPKSRQSYDTLRYYFIRLAYLLKLRRMGIGRDAVIYTRNAEIVWLFKKRGYKVFFEAHNWPAGKSRLYRYCLRAANLIICNSRGTAEAHNAGGLNRTMVAPNGVDLSEFDIKKDQADLRRELGLPLDKKIIMYVGHLYKWKGIDTVIEAAELCRSDRETRFVIVGGQESILEKYQDLCRKKKLDNIVFLGYQPKEKMPAYMNAADILLLPNIPNSTESVNYTSPLKMFEYMATGKPIIASDLPSIREVLNEKNSVLVKAGDAKALREAIQKILTDKDLSGRITEQAMNDVRQYSWEKRAQNILFQINNGS